MTALAILCARGHPLTETARDAVVQGFDTPEPAGRRAAIYALGRCARPSAEVLALANEREVIVDRLVPHLEQGDDEEQRLVWKALAALGERPEKIPARVLSADPPDWKTEVEAIRALTASQEGRAEGLDRLDTLDLSHFSGPRHHVLIELLRGLRSAIAGDEDLAARLPRLREKVVSAAASADAGRAHALAVARCEIELLASIAAGSLDPLLACDDGIESLPDTYAESLSVEALLHMGSAMTREQRVEELLRRAQDDRAPVATPALAALAEVDDPRANTVLRRALDRMDVGITSAAAGAIAARSVDASKRDAEAVPVLVRTVERLTNRDAVEARIAAIEALGSLGRDAEPGVGEGPGPGQADDSPRPWLEDLILPLRADPSVAVRRAARDALLDHPDLLRRFDEGAIDAGGEFGDRLADAWKSMREAAVSGLRFSTTAGEFVLDFEGAPAPINQANLVDLAREDYFDGLRWHRVVPDFVVQGGDPRGDGYGGPGYLVPCEWSNLHYGRGTVGIALAGKDTGGSQLFIAHSPQPHLDARYTIVGRVREGMEVVDRLMPADRILDVSLVTGAP
jgi:cyclophilin family peptidyl-prolyl cis-trans isomerase